jgi:hypothetical protein
MAVHILILWAVIAATVAVIGVIARRRTLHPPHGSGAIRFSAAAFGVILGLTTFFATGQVSSLTEAAQDEASSVGDLVIASGPFPLPIGTEVRRQAFCYANDVVEDDWPAMKDGHEFGARSVEARESAIYVAVLRAAHTHPEPSTLNTAVSSGLELGRQRERRLLLNQPQIPTELWVLIYVGSVIIFIFVFFDQIGYGDKRASRGERVWTSLGVVLMLSAVIGVLAHLDRPTADPFGLQPKAMRHELQVLAGSIKGDTSDPEAFCRTVPVPRQPPVTLR